MAIKPKCDKCNTELQDYGAILLSPPDSGSMVLKMHICKPCYKDLMEDFTVSM